MRYPKTSFLKRARARVLKRNLSQKQRDGLNFLVDKGVSERVALVAVTKPQTTLDMIKDKIAVFESVKLDKSLCGVSQIPTYYYEHALVDSVTKCRVWHLNAVINRIKTDYAEKQLDGVFPGWRDKPAIQKVGAPLLYQRVLELQKRNIPITTHTLITFPVSKGHLKPVHKSEKMRKSAESRVERMRELGIPLINLPRKISMDEHEFEIFLQRQRNGLRTTNQQEVFEYLTNLRIKKEIVEELSSRKGLSLKSVKRKADFVMALELDVETYGVDRLPKEYWQVGLGMTFQHFVGFVKTTKRKLGDKHAIELLDKEFSGLSQKPKLRDRSPQSILAKARMLKELGRSVNAYAIKETPIETLTQLIAQKRGLAKSKPRTRRRQAKESASEFVRQNKLPVEVFNQMLFRLHALHRMRQRDRAIVGKDIADPAIIVDAIRSKKTIRNRVSERNMNLFANWALGQNPIQIQPIVVERKVETDKDTTKPVQRKNNPAELNKANYKGVVYLNSV